MPYMTNDLPIDLNQLEQWETARSQRIGEFKKMYTRDTAQELIDMATQYHWLNPQITAALVLNGAGYLVPAAATHAAEKMADAGMSVTDRYRVERVARRVNDYFAKGANA